MGRWKARENGGDGEGEVIGDGKEGKIRKVGVLNFELSSALCPLIFAFPMSCCGEVLVVIMNNRADWAIAQDQRWYRIPLDQMEKLKHRNQWLPPKWLAFYQTKVFGETAHAVNYYAEIIGMKEVTRRDLFPDESANNKSDKRYCKLELSPLQRLPQPINSHRLRRITFIPTTWKKFRAATEINDLWDESPLEDDVWDALKKLDIKAERQQDVKVKEKHYFLDFAIYCENGKINIETDGDRWHVNTEQSQSDNYRNNDLETQGWHVLRFTTYQVKEQLADYCIPTIVKTINRLGGLAEANRTPRRLQWSPTESTEQLTLF